MAGPSYSFKVRTYCATFNHKSYILDALKGFAMQQTTFPVVYTIVDDASTDGTAVVIKQFVTEYFNLGVDAFGYDKEMDYGHVTFARHKTNKNCYFAVIYLKENHFSQRKSKNPYLTEWMDTKYIALCEGDDYWTDPMKLQKQVDFLEEHEDVGICYTDYSRFGEADKVMTQSMFEKQGQYRPTTYEQHLLKPGYLAPMTWVYRKELLGYIDNRGGFVDGTYMYMLEWFYHSKVEYLPINTAVYCSHEGSASFPVDVKGLFRYCKGVFDTQVYYANKYPCSTELSEKISVRGYLDLIPVAVKAENEDFIGEAKSYLESKDYCVEIIIRDLKEGQSMRKSYAYRVGKAIVSPFSWLKKKCNTPGR